jgi:hypothetical protein
MRLTTRLYEKKIRKYFPYFRTIEIRKFIAQANEQSICIVDKSEILKYINEVIIDNNEEYKKLRAFNLFYRISISKQFTVDNLYKAIRHITPEYIKEKHNNKENKMNDTKLNEIDEEELDNIKDKKEKQQLEFLDERVRLDFNEEENLTDNVNIE